MCDRAAAAVEAFVPAFIDAFQGVPIRRAMPTETVGRRSPSLYSKIIANSSLRIILQRCLVTARLELLKGYERNRECEFNSSTRHCKSFSAQN